MCAEARFYSCAGDVKLRKQAHVSLCLFILHRPAVLAVGVQRMLIRRVGATHHTLSQGIFYSIRGEIQIYQTDAEVVFFFFLYFPQNWKKYKNIRKAVQGQQSQAQ